jgi:hypothetical protein
MPSDDRGAPQKVIGTVSSAHVRAHAVSEDWASQPKQGLRPAMERKPPFRRALFDRTSQYPTDALTWTER